MASHRHSPRVRGTTSIASAPYRQVVAAVWPDGKLVVGSWPSRWVTSGRTRWTIVATLTNSPSSPAMATATNTAGRQRPIRASARGAMTRPIARIQWVPPAWLRR